MLRSQGFFDIYDVSFGRRVHSRPPAVYNLSEIELLHLGRFLIQSVTLNLGTFAIIFLDFFTHHSGLACAKIINIFASTTGKLRGARMKDPECTAQTAYA